MGFWRAAPDGVTVLVKVRPRARGPGLGGRMASAAGERLRVAVTEAPENGRANEAVRLTLARALDIPVASVRVAAGLTSREKRLDITGDPSALALKLEAF